MSTPSGTERSYGAQSAGSTNNPAQEKTFGRKLRYRFDNTLARGPIVLIGWLLFAAALLSLPFWLYLQLDPDGIDATGTKPGPDNLFSSFWAVLGKGGFPSNGWEGRSFSILITIASLVTGGAMFAFITATTSKKLTDLKRGKGPVVESGHVMILGWGPQVYSILQQLDVANQNSPGTAVILSSTPQETMVDEIRNRVGKLKHTKIITRSVEPSNPKILADMSVARAKSVIVLGNKGTPGSITGVLSALSNLAVDSTTTVIADVNDTAAANALMQSTQGRVVTVESQELIAQVTAHACRQPGLAAIYLDLLDFEGNEMYYEPAAEAAGHMFGEALLAYPNASLIGIRRPDGAIWLYPPMNTVINADDYVIAIAQDDDQIIWNKTRPELDSFGAQTALFAAPRTPPSQTLVIGWNSMAKKVLREIGDYATPGSAALVMAQAARVTSDELKDLSTQNMQVITRAYDGSFQELAAALPGSNFDQVIIFGYRGKTQPADADAQTLLSLLAVNTLKQWGAFGYGRARIIAEILDSNNVELARVVAVEDLVVSDRLASLMMTQLSQSPHLSPIFQQLFGPGGVYLSAKPINYYVPSGEISYAQLVAAGRARGEVIIGYRDNEAGTGLTAGIHLNPSKDSTFIAKPSDQAIVIGPME
ncbi:MAG: CASTOR/POLLUX-related putative ion channel [Candidatus Nanopelagicaceae bacterium]